MRMKNRLGISSEEFLARYTLMPTDRHQRYPVVLLEMTDTANKHCPFVSQEQGCTMYEDRPWACRMYPVGLASPADEDRAADEKEFFFLIKDTFCRGHEEDQGWTIRDWMRNQEVAPYNEMGKLFKEVAMHKWFKTGKDLSPEQIGMFFMVCYNLDAFRRMVFESSFLERFEVDKSTVERIREDDAELLKFGFQWLKFSLFGEPTISVRPSALAEARAKRGA
jgi:Fe-S-cluster containining protein